MPDIIAHRGASHDAPENTLPAFELAWQQGADGMEVDVYLSTDCEIVCAHDKSLERTAGVDRDVADCSFAELRALDVGAWKGAAWGGTTLPTLAEALAAVAEGRKVYIEVKCGVEIVEPLKRVIDACGLAPEQVRIISFHEDVIAAAKRAMPHIGAYWLTSFREDDAGVWTPTVDTVLATLARLRADGVDAAAKPPVDEAFVAAIHAAGMECHVWTVDEAPLARRLAALGVDSITTNRPALIGDALGSP